MEILIVCTGNTCRSPMAEGILNALIAENDLEDCYVMSAGVATSDGLPASHNAILAVGELGCDISMHQSRQLTQGIVDNSDIILCMTQSHKNSVIECFDNADKKAFTLAEAAGENDMDITDPYGGDSDDYNECADDLNMLLNGFIANLQNGDYDD